MSEQVQAAAGSASGEPNYKVPTRGWIVLFAGLLSNFSVGILYTWSNLKGIFSTEAFAETAWQDYSALPYQVGGMVFAIFLIFAGTLQDKIGPKWVMLAGVIMVGIGTIISGQFVTNAAAFSWFFGIVVGIGLAFVYACPRPAAMKWFPAAKKGMINGIVVAGFGLGALWLGPLELFLLGKFQSFQAADGTMLSGPGDVAKTLMIMGILIMVIGVPCSLLVVDPPKGYVIPAVKLKPGAVLKDTQKKAPSVSTATAAKTPQAWMLLCVYALFCSAGALVISNVAQIMQFQGDVAKGASILGIMVPIVAVSNASGRALGGFVSDSLGRKPTYFIIHALAAANMLMMTQVNSQALIIVGVIVACASYGAALSVTPSTVADYFGLKAYGGNYGLVYYGWGLSLVIGPQASEMLTVNTLNDEGGIIDQDFTKAYFAAIVMLAVSATLVFLLKQPKFRPDQIIDDEPIEAAANAS